MRTGKRVFGSVAAGGAIAILLYALSAGPGQTPQQTDSEAPAAGAAQHDPSVHRSALKQAVSPTDHPPTLSDNRPQVIVERGPRTPWENRLQYENRINFTTGFDHFLASADLSPDKERRLLLALYDYQEANHAVYRDMTMASGERFIRDEPYPERLVYEMVLDTEMQLATAIERVLSPEELRLFYLQCAGCYMYVATDQRILRLSDEPPGPADR